ncbi:MAG: PQQ-binding-like beta-propeller repeat protein [Myxococcales bacterium]|nr:PQQ-binding-like beta-propeller repeat protein [Myxococcales bacterium]
MAAHSKSASGSDAGSKSEGGDGGSGQEASASTGSSSTGNSQGASGDAEWTMIGYDLASSYFNRAETVLTKDNAASLEEIWSADMGSSVYGAPLQVGDRIFASSAAGVRAFEADTGTELWAASPSSTASMAYADGTLYVNDTQGQIVALNAEDGSVLWTQAPDGQGADGSSSPLVVDDLVVIGGSSGGRELFGGAFRGYLAALDRNSGEVSWVTYTVPMDAKGAAIWSSPSADMATGRIYGSTGNNYGHPATDTSDALIAFDVESGEIIWKNQREENDTFGGGIGMRDGPDFDFGANPVLYEAMVDGTMTELVSAGAKSGTAHALRRDDGSEVWSRNLGAGSTNGTVGIFVNSTWSGKHMLFAHNEDPDGTLFALDGGTGDIVWEKPLPGAVWGRMSVANGVGFVGAGTTLVVFDVETGDILKEIPSSGGTVAGTISIANGRVAYGEGLTWQSGQPGTTLHVLQVTQ